jgi:hypothetical protein
MAAEKVEREAKLGAAAMVPAEATALVVGYRVLSVTNPPVEHGMTLLAWTP